MKCTNCDGEGRIPYGRRVSAFGGDGFRVEGYHRCRECGGTGDGKVQAKLKAIDGPHEARRAAIIAHANDRLRKQRRIEDEAEDDIRRLGEAGSEH